MLILIEWKDNGGLFRHTDGRIVFKSYKELSKFYLPFVHHSPAGEAEDKVIYVWKAYYAKEK